MMRGEMIRGASKPARAQIGGTSARPLATTGPPPPRTTPPWTTPPRAPPPRRCALAVAGNDTHTTAAIATGMNFEQVMADSCQAWQAGDFILARIIPNEAFGHQDRLVRAVTLDRHPPAHLDASFLVV